MQRVPGKRTSIYSITKGLFCAYLHLYQVLKPTLKNQQSSVMDCSEVPDSGVSGELSKCHRKKVNHFPCASGKNSEKRSAGAMVRADSVM